MKHLVKHAQLNHCPDIVEELIKRFTIVNDNSGSVHSSQTMKILSGGGGLNTMSSGGILGGILGINHHLGGIGGNYFELLWI